MHRLASCALLLALAWPAVAQDKKAAAADQVRRMQAANQKLASEKAQLERDKAALQKQKDELEQGSAQLKKAAGARAAAVKRLEKELEEARAATGAKEAERARLADALAAAQKAGEELRQQVARVSADLELARADAARLRQRLANQGDTSRFWQSRTESCEGNNTTLARLNTELIDRYLAKTCGDVMLQNEPFTGVGRARAENEAAVLRERVSMERFRWNAPPPQEAQKAP
jgi:chromosome segregation ATPase